MFFIQSPTASFTALVNSLSSFTLDSEGLRRDSLLSSSNLSLACSNVKPSNSAEYCIVSYSMCNLDPCTE